MTQRFWTLAFTVALFVVGSVAAAGSQQTTPKKEVYVSTAKQRKLLEKGLPTVDGKQITVIDATFPAGWIGGRHSHTGPVYVYVLEGAFTIDADGQPRRTLKPGDLFEEPIGAAMTARNLSTSEPTRILLFQIGGHGEPLMLRAD